MRTLINGIFFFLIESIDLYYFLGVNSVSLLRLSNDLVLEHVLSQQESRVAAFGVNFSLYVCLYPCRILENDVCFTIACTLVFRISSKDYQIFRLP